MLESQISARIEVDHFRSNSRENVIGSKRNIFVEAHEDRIFIWQDEKNLFSKPVQNTLNIIHLESITKIVASIRVQQARWEFEEIMDSITLVLEIGNYRSTLELSFRRPKMAVEFLTRLIQRFPVRPLSYRPMVLEELGRLPFTDYRCLEMVRRHGVTRLVESPDAREMVEV